MCAVLSASNTFRYEHVCVCTFVHTIQEDSLCLAQSGALSAAAAFIAQRYGDYHHHYGRCIALTNEQECFYFYLPTLSSFYFGSTNITSTVHRFYLEYETVNLSHFSSSSCRIDGNLSNQIKSEEEPQSRITNHSLFTKLHCCQGLESLIILILSLPLQHQSQAQCANGSWNKNWLEHQEHQQHSKATSSPP